MLSLLDKVGRLFGRKIANGDKARRVGHSRKPALEVLEDRTAPAITPVPAPLPFADLVTIDFERLGDSEIIGDQYADQGVRFRGELSTFENPSTTPAIFRGDVSDPVWPPLSGTVMIRGRTDNNTLFVAFESPVSHFGVHADELFFRRPQPVTLTAYDDTLNELGSVTGTSGGSGVFALPDYRFIGFTSDSPVWAVRVSAPAENLFAFDDLVFQSLPNLSISHLSRTTFIATDSISLRASIGSATAGVEVRWTVEGRDAAAGIGGFATDFVTITDATGTATFTFTASDNTTFVNDRRTRWTRGSYQANLAISFEVTASYLREGVERTTRLSDTNLGPLSQDETDILRQEYYDYNIPVPARDEVVPSLGAGFNRGNYSVQLAVDMRENYDAILAAYRGREVRVTIDGQEYVTRIPQDASLTVSSGYRNPQRNRAVGSQFPDSRHTRGRALDLVPSAVQVVVMVNGRPRRVTLSLHEALYPALHAAAATVGTAIAEQGATQVPVGDPREDHIHVQW
jgi:hypothetical protein